MYFSLYISFTFLSRRCPWNKQWRLNETQDRRESGRHLLFSRVSNKISVDSTFLKRMRDISPLCCKIHFDGVIMCQECDLLRAHAFLHAFRYGGLWQAFVVQWRTDWRTGKPSRLRWDALFASEEWRNRFLNQNRGAALEALVRDKRGLLAILPTGYGKLLVYQLSFSRCIQCHS